VATGLGWTSLASPHLTGAIRHPHTAAPHRRPSASITCLVTPTTVTTTVPLLQIITILTAEGAIHRIPGRRIQLDAASDGGAVLGGPHRPRRVRQQPMPSWDEQVRRPPSSRSRWRAPALNPRGARCCTSQGAQACLLTAPARRVGAAHPSPAAAAHSSTCIGCNTPLMQPLADAVHRRELCSVSNKRPRPHTPRPLPGILPGEGGGAMMVVGCTPSEAPPLWDGPPVRSNTAERLLAAARSRVRGSCTHTPSYGLRLPAVDNHPWSRTS
jgi:hypothetical protein